MAGRMLGVDYGEARIGLAVSDPTGTIASPIEAIGATGSGDPLNVANIAADHGASTIVVGLPLSLDGTYGPAARKVNAFCIPPNHERHSSKCKKDCHHDKILVLPEFPGDFSFVASFVASFVDPRSDLVFRVILSHDLRRLRPGFP